MNIQTQSIWEKLQNTSKNIYLYGLGLGTEKILKVFQEKNIKLTSLVISDAQRKIPKDFRHFEFMKISHALKDENGILLLGFGTQKREMLDYFYELDDNYEVYSPDVPVFGEGIFDYEYYKKNEGNFKKAYEMLADDISKQTFEATINYKITGQLKYLRNFTQHKDEIFNDVLKLKQDEVFIDLGAYTGDTLLETMHYGGFEKAYAFEPDKKNFDKMLTNNEKNELKNVNALNIGVWESEEILTFSKKSSRNSSLMQDAENMESISVNSVDNVLCGSSCTYIKMDVEGAEFQAIKGATNTIKNYAPKLNVAAYHRNEDLFALILQISEINSSYKFYIRHHEYVPSWDTNLYAVK